MLPQHPDSPAQRDGDGLSRRDALRRLGAGGVVASLLALVGEAARAQQVTPTPAYAPGVHLTILGRKEAIAAPGYYLQLARINSDPGSNVPPHTHPGDMVTYQLSGSGTFTILSGQARLVRAGSSTPAAGPAGEPMVMGREYTTHPGDVLLFDAHTAHIGSNPTTEPAVLLEAELREIGKPLTIPLATPTP